jgi:parallel beta-helix repeat protein
MKTVLTIIFTIFSFCSFGAKYYFANAGSDAGAGTIGSPWQTITKFNALFPTLNPGDSVLFNGGDKFLGAPRLTASGLSGNSIVVTSYGTGMPIWSGFYTFSGFTLVSGNVYEATCVGCAVTVNMVRVNGSNQYQGRYPDITNGQAGYLYQTAATSTSITGPTLSTDTNWTGANLATRNNDFSIETHTITNHVGGVISVAGFVSTPVVGYGYFMQNDPRTLTLFGEWYWKNSTSKMQVYMPGGLGSNTIEAATVDTIVVITGSYVTLKGIKIEGANKMGVSFISNVNNDSIINCNIQFCGINGIDIKSASSTVLSNCTFANTPIRYANNMGFNCIYPCEVHDSKINGDSIEYCADIPGMGATGSGTYGGLTIFGIRDSIYNNNFFHIGGAATTQYGGSPNIYYRNHVDSFNLHLCDGGGIYISVHDGGPDSLIENIVSHGIGQHFGTTHTVNAFAHGYYLDSRASNIIVLRNTADSCSGSGIFLHSAKQCKVMYNNFYSNGTSGVNLDTSPGDSIRNDTIMYNNMVATNITQLAGYYVANGSSNDVAKAGRLDSNVISNALDETSVIETFTPGHQFMSLATWKTLYSLDLHSKISPVALSNAGQFLFFSNPTNSNQTFVAPRSYYTPNRVSVGQGNLVLTPYQSVILYQQPNLIPLFPFK